MLTDQASAASLWSWLLLAPVLIAGLFAPGYLIFQRLRSPHPWLSSFIGSGLILFHGVLLIDLTPLRLNLFSLGTFLVLISLIGCRFGQTIRLKPTFPSLNWCKAWRESWWLLPAGFSFVSLLVRAYVEPLAGFDNFFRWDYLAQLMQSQGSLAHYPPVTALDFRFYPWCDGIPPLVPIINLWIYLGTGSNSGTLIAGRLLVELGLTLGLVWHLARGLWGGVGARVAVLALSSCTIFLWSIGIEQETGLSGVSLLAIASFGLAYKRNPSQSTAIWTGLAAALGALTRDYNLILIPIAGTVLLLARAPRRHLLIALGVALLAVTPWYARNWYITGNPLFPHDLGGLFQSNFVHNEWMQSIRNYWSLGSPHVHYITLWLGLGVGLGPLLLVSLPGLNPRHKKSRVIGLLLLTNVFLWLASISSTAGGWIYSLRVLGTSMPLLAVAAGWWGPRLRGKLPWLFAAILLPFCADAARRSWMFASAPFIPSWPYTWTSWSNYHHYVTTSRQSPAWSVLAKAAYGEVIVVDSPNYFVLGLKANGVMVPLFSPEAAPLTTAPLRADLSHIVTALRKQGVRYVILTDDGRHNREFLLGRPGLRKLLHTKPTYRAESMSIYDIERISSRLTPDLK